MRALTRGGKYSTAACITFVLAILLSACDDNGDDTSTASDGDPCIRVAFVYESDVARPGFERSQKMGEESLREELPCAEVTSVESIREGPGSEQTFERLANEGHDLVFGLSFGYGDQIANVAADNPDVMFEHALGFQPAENISTFTGARYEGYYLAGIVAAEQIPSGRLGFIGPFPIPIIVSDLNAFTLGARSVNPEATVQVVWTNDFEDPTRDRQAAGALIDEGVDLIAQSTGSPSVGEAAVEADLPWMGHSDAGVQQFGPATFLAAPFLDWGLYFVARANDVIDGSWESEEYFGTIADGFVDIALSENVPADVAEAVEAKKQEIADGSFVVFQGPIRGQDGTVVVAEGETASLEEMAAFLVEGVIGEIPEE